ncbi:MAG: succinate dehydrogenase/fumarate reductase iron-sulfur subunit [Candidatus Micrarchaeota archaeon]|nr:succinate dehydrogenase/fumarate reductase iron-sulfur subunit [Candidatus Micrarchaeota archaeon]
MRSIKMRVYRQDPEKDSSGRYEEYAVQVEEGMVVLGAIISIIESIDSTLSARWNCEAARCGSCSAEINGVPRLMCKTRLDGLGDVVTVGPMRAFRLVKDLVTDVSENYDAERKIPEFHPDPSARRPWKMAGMDVARSKEFRKCIECYLCMDVCHVIREHKASYIGPRHVIKAAALDMHPLDTIDRSEMLNKDSGIGYCNVTKCCQEVCPEHIKITDNAIIPEKERGADSIYDPLGRLFKKKGSV